MNVQPVVFQHLDLKIPLRLEPGQPLPDLSALIPVFHRWVRERLVPGELLIDVADYRHVPNGPGVMVVGHESNTSLDLTDGKPGLRYVRKTPVAGDTQAALAQAWGALTHARRLLEDDPALGGAFRFDRHAVEVRVNDRLLAPNEPKTLEALLPEVLRLFDAAVSRGTVDAAHTSRPRELFCLTFRTSVPLDSAPLDGPKPQRLAS